MTNQPRFYDLTIPEDPISAGSLFIDALTAAINIAVSKVLGSPDPKLVETAGKYIFLGHLNAANTLTTDTYEVKVRLSDDQSQIIIGEDLYPLDVVVDASLGVATGAAIVAALGLSGGPAAIAAFGGAIFYSAFLEPITEDILFTLSGGDEVKLYDGDGEHIMGMLYPDGIAQASDVDAVYAFLTHPYLTGENLTGMTVEIDDSLVSSRSFTVTGIEVYQAMAGRAGLSLLDFRTTGSNDDYYVANSSGEYVFYQQNPGLSQVLAMPVTLGGTAQTVALHNVFINGAHVWGDEEGTTGSRNLIIGNEGTLLTNRSGERNLIIGSDEAEAIDLAASSLGIGDYDTVIGGAGNDTIFASDAQGEDIIDGGAGVDAIYYGAQSNDVSVSLVNGSLSEIHDFGISEKQTLYNIENATTGSGDDTVVGSSAANAIIGGTGDDVLDGGAGADTLVGGSGDDVLVGSAGSFEVYDGGLGSDLLNFAGATGAVAVNLDIQKLLYEGDVQEVYNMENLRTGAFDDTVEGNNRANVINLHAGDDWASGYGGNDVLNGGSGNDVLFGDGGNDVLRGGLGNDTLIGGAGDDRYVFDLNADGHDIVSDSDSDGGTLVIGSHKIEEVTATARAGEPSVYDVVNDDGFDFVATRAGLDLILSYRFVGVESTITLRNFVDGMYGIVLDNAVPQLRPDFLQLAPNGSGSINVLANDSDVDGELDGSTLIFDVPPGLSFSYSTNGQVSVSAGNEETTHVISYSVSDDSGNIAESTLTIQVGEGSDEEEGSGEDTDEEEGGEKSGVLWPDDAPTYISPDNEDGQAGNGANNTSSTWGDPHLVTFDGLAYDFHMPGEFVLMQSTAGDGFEIQTRHEYWNGSQLVSGNTAVAIRLGTEKVGFYLPDTFNTDFTIASHDDDYLLVGQGSVNAPGFNAGFNAPEVNALGGNDTINGSDLDDVIAGGEGRDVIFGQHGSDSLDGGSGNDTLLGGSGNDHIRGSQGNNILIGGHDNGGMQQGTTTSTVELVASHGSYHNVFGYYVKDASGVPTTGNIIWTNTLMTAAGDVFTIDASGNEADIGFFLIPNGASYNGSLRSGDEVTFSEVNGVLTVIKDGMALVSEYGNAPAFFSDSHLNADGFVHHSGDETQQGWEELLGGGDQSFNDVIINTSIHSSSTIHYGDTLVGGSGADVFGYHVGSDGYDWVSGFTAGQDSLAVSGVTWGEIVIAEGDGGSHISFNGHSGGLFVEGQSASAVSSAITILPEALASRYGTLNVDEIPMLYVGEQAIALPDGASYSLAGGTITREGDDLYTVTNHEGDSMSLEVNYGIFDVHTTVSADRSGQLQGLLGNADGDSSNEFQLKDGTVLGEALSPNTLYDIFGQQWRITQEESLFIYGDGQNSASFDDANFVNRYPSLDDLDPGKVAAAEAQLIALGYDPHASIFESMVMDAVLFGGVEAAELLQDLAVETQLIEGDVSSLNPDLYLGTNDDDVIYGSGGNDILQGRAGNDVLIGQSGMDLFIHHAGDGNDHLYSGEYNSSDTVLMYGADGALLTEAQLQFTVSSHDLIITDRSNGETITLDNMYYASGKTFATVNGIEVGGAMYFVGNDNNETLYGTAFNDTLEGGLGNDVLIGQSGMDLFIHHAGDGNDHLYSGEYNSSDTVLMYGADGALLTEAQLQFTVSSHDLIITDRSNGETITLDNMYYASGKTFATVNGIEVGGAMHFVGNDNNETLYGTAFNDTLEGGLGNDVLVGQSGMDLFVHHAGDGNDHLYSGEYNSSDTVLMYGADGALLTEAQLQFTVSSHDLIITDRSNGETITLDNMYYASGKTFATVNGIEVGGAMHFVGNDNNETLYGTAFNDTLEGGLGNDVLIGQSGMDLFIHHAGDGNDHLYSGEYNSSDVVLMYDIDGTLLEESELSFMQSGHDLVATNLNNGESVTLDNMYYAAGNTFGWLNVIELDTII